MRQSEETSLLKIVEWLHVTGKYKTVERGANGHEKKRDKTIEHTHSLSALHGGRSHLLLCMATSHSITDPVIKGEFPALRLWLRLPLCTRSTGEKDGGHAAHSVPQDPDWDTMERHAASVMCVCVQASSPAPSSPRYTLTHMVPSPEPAGHRTLTQQQVPGCGRNLSSDQLWTRGPTARAEKMLQRRGRVKNLKGGQCPCLPCHGTKGEGEGGRDRLRHTRKTEPGSGGLIQCQAWKPRSIFRLTVSETG